MYVIVFICIFNSANEIVYERKCYLESLQNKVINKTESNNDSEIYSGIINVSKHHPMEAVVKLDSSSLSLTEILVYFII